MESSIELLNRFGTDYPEEEEKAADLRKKYLDLLARTWVQRGKGLPYAKVIGLTILVVCLLLLAGGVVIFAFTQSGAVGSQGKGILALLTIVVYGIIIVTVLLQVLPVLNINHRTKTNIYQNFPKIREAAERFADASKGEVVRDYIPILRITGRTLYYIAYIQKGDPTKLPVGILVLDDQGRAVQQDEALVKAKLTAFIGITCGHINQRRAGIIRRSMKNVVGRQIPDAVRILKSQEQQFARRGLSAQWTSVLESASILPQALQESISILDGEEAFRKAMGYSFALEFWYDDAMKLRELYLAYVRYFNAAYRRKIISLTTEASVLIQTIEPMTDWPNRNEALTALSTLALAGPNGVLSRVCQKEYEGIVNEGERKAYQEKTLQAQNMGWPVISGVWRQRRAWNPGEH
jgi:hypothetical protein